jgi:hypothetical protein
MIWQVARKHGPHMTTSFWDLSWCELSMLCLLSVATGKFSSFGTGCLFYPSKNRNGIADFAIFRHSGRETVRQAGCAGLRKKPSARFQDACGCQGVNGATASLVISAMPHSEPPSIWLADRQVKALVALVLG